MELEDIALKGYKTIHANAHYPSYKNFIWIEPTGLPSKCPKCQTALLDSAGNPTDELGYDEQKPPKKIQDIEGGKYDALGNYRKFKDRIREIVHFRQRYKCKACGKRFFADTPEIDSQLRYTNRFLDAVVAYALQYGYTRRTVVETGLSTSTLTKYVNDAIEQKYLNRRWHGARTIALYTQKFFHGKKYCLCINVENISLMEMILCTGDKKEREGFDYFVQHMQVKPERVLIDIDSDNTAKRVASTYFPNVEILADSIYVRKILDRILRQAYDSTLRNCNKDYNFSLLKDRGKDVFIAEDGANRAVPDNVRQRMQTAYPVLWNQYVTRCHGLRPYKVEPKKQEPTFDNWSQDVTQEPDNAIFISALLNIVPFKELLLAFARKYYNVPRVDYVQEVEALECNLKEKAQDGLRKNVSWKLFRSRILYGTIVDVYARRYNRAAYCAYHILKQCCFYMDLCAVPSGNAYDTIEQLVPPDNFEISIESILLALAYPLQDHAPYEPPKSKNEGAAKEFYGVARDMLQSELELTADEIEDKPISSYPKLRMKWWDMPADEVEESGED